MPEATLEVTRATGEETQPSPQSERVNTSVEKYLTWRRGLSEGLKSFDYGWSRAIEPGRANVWCHATSLEGAIAILSSGYLKSAQSVLIEGGRLEHAPSGRIKKPPEFIRKGTVMTAMSARQQQEALDWAPHYISGTLGKILEKYTPSASSTDLQAGFVFPLPTLEAQGLVLKSCFFRENEVISPGALEEHRMRLKYLPNRLYYSEYGQGYEQGALEIDFDTPLNIEGGVLLIREDQVELVAGEIKKRMVQAGKSNEQIEQALNKIVGFSPRFKTIDEAVGWLTNTPEGQEIVQTRTGVNISEIPQAQINPETSYLQKFIEENQRRIKSIKGKIENFSRLPPDLQLSEEDLAVHQREIEYREILIAQLEKQQQDLGNHGSTT